MRKICLAGIGAAMYVALSMMLSVPLYGNIRIDAGYIALVVFCYVLPRWYSCFVAVAGCTLVSIITSGWIPWGWIPANFLIALSISAVIRSATFITVKQAVRVGIVGVFACAVGMLVVKTGIECLLFSIPVAVKTVNNAIAFVCDSIGIIIGCFVMVVLSKHIRKIKC